MDTSFLSAQHKDIEQSSITACLHVLIQSPAFEHATFNLMRVPGMPMQVPFVRTTYPATWLERYFSQNFAAIDPIVRTCITATHGVYWDAVQATPTEAQVMIEFQAAGLGQVGFSMPVVDSWNRKGVLSLSSNLPTATWHALLDPIQDRLQRFALNLIDKALMELYDNAHPSVALCETETRYLQAIAQGLNVLQLTKLLDQDEVSIRHALEQARQKLEAVTLEETVAKALSLGLIKI